MLDGSHTTTLNIEARLSKHGLDEDNQQRLAKNADRVKHIIDDARLSGTNAPIEALRAHWQVIAKGEFGAEYVSSARKLMRSCECGPSEMFAVYRLIIEAAMFSVGLLATPRARKVARAVTRAAMFDMDTMMTLVTMDQNDSANGKMRKMGSDLRHSIGEIVESLAGASHQNSGAVQDAASAATQLSSQLVGLREKMASATSTSKGAASLAQSANQQIGHLADKVDTISDAVRMINEIANKTNLLALNASIEAARAGTVGRGFNVVAGEVKNLATQTTQVTENINSQIEAIRDETERAVANFTQILEQVTAVNDASNTVSHALDEQSNVLGGVIMTSVQQSRSGSEDVARQAQTLRDTADRFIARLEQHS